MSDKHEELISAYERLENSLSNLEAHYNWSFKFITMELEDLAKLIKELKDDN